MTAKQKNYENARNNLIQSLETFLVKLTQQNDEQEFYKECITNTPRRFVEALEEMTAGMVSNATWPKQVTFESDYDGIVWLNDIQFASVCEHHLMPFMGVAHIAYIPNGHIIGASKLARAVQYASSRLSTQEEITQMIRDDILLQIPDIKGIAVVMEAAHTCIACRGIKSKASKMVTSSLAGAFLDEGPARQEFLSFISRR